MPTTHYLVLYLIPTLQSLTTEGLRNPFEIARSTLLGHVTRMRTHFLHQTTLSSPTNTMADESERYCTPHCIYIYMYVLLFL